MSTPYAFAKGHGTENDFVLLPDPDASVHGLLDATRVRALCDRRAGIGGDGVIRVVRTAALADLGVPEAAEALAQAPDATWFMDYRNADGSVAEMCGNGVRVLARYLLDELGATGPLRVATRGGTKDVVAHDDGTLAVGMGVPADLPASAVAVGERRWATVGVDMGNPHAVALLGDGEDLDAAGDLLAEPAYDRGVYPEGVNVEFVVRRGERHVAFRVHERGSGETRSCGTGAAAVAVVVMRADGIAAGEERTYVVDVPGGRLHATWTPGQPVVLRGPAVLVAGGTTTL